MSVVGFDIGNDRCVVAVARRRGIDVLQNDVGNRKTASLVAFSGRQRMIGDAATGQMSGNVKNTLFNFKRLLGRHADDADMKLEKLYMPGINLGPVNGKQAGYTVMYNDEPMKITPEQVTAAMFSKLKLVAESGLEGQKVSDCVICCPPYWTEAQRRAMLDAANVAGLNVLRLMNETTAVALNYGILRPLPEKGAQKVMFLDMGDASTNCAVVSFTQGKLNVLATASDRNLGGRDFDLLLVDHFKAHIQKTYKLDPTNEPKAMYKLFKECRRVKQILSANSKVPFAIEFFQNDTDVKGMIERPEFEALANAKLMPRLSALINQCLAEAGVKKEELAALEVVGGAVRIPIVGQKLQEFFGREISRTCDGDESVARGCALQCAMLSPSFRVKEFEVHDICPYPIDLAWGAAPAKTPETLEKFTDPMDIESTAVFPVRNELPSVKLISFNDRTDTFQLIARYSDMKNAPPGTSDVLGRWLISGLPAQADKSKPASVIKVRVKLNLHGTISVTSAQLVEEITPDPAGTAAAPTPTAAAAAGAAPMETGDATPKAGDATPKADDKDKKPADDKKGDDKKGDDKKGDAKPASDKEKADKEKADKEKADKEKADKEAEAKKKKVRRIDLKIAPYPCWGIDQKTLQSYFEKEGSMAAADKLIAETNEARNALEGFVLDMRSRVGTGDLKEFVRAAPREEFLSQLTVTEEWLYNDGLEVSKSEYKKRLTDLKVVSDGALSRQWEQNHRQEYCNTLKRAANDFKAWAVSAEKDAKFAHITEADRKKVVSEADAALAWLDAELTKQGGLPIADPPVLTCDHINKKKLALDTAANPIVNKPKPEPPKPAPEPAKKPEDPKAGATNGAAAGSDAKPDAKPAADGKEKEKEKEKEAPKADAKPADAKPADAKKA